MADEPRFKRGDVIQWRKSKSGGFVVRAWIQRDEYGENPVEMVEVAWVSHKHYDTAEYESKEIFKVPTLQVGDRVRAKVGVSYWGYVEEVIFPSDWDTEIEQGEGVSFESGLDFPKVVVRWKGGKESKFRGTTSIKYMSELEKEADYLEDRWMDAAKRERAAKVEGGLA